MHKVKPRSLRLVALLLITALLSTSPALAYSPSGVKVLITAERQGDILTTTLQMQDVSFNVMSIVLGYDRAVLTPVQADGTAVTAAKDVFDVVAPVYQPGDWVSPAKGWLTPVEPGIQLDQAAGAMQYSFYVEPNGEGVDTETKCISAPASGTVILKLHFKVNEQGTLRYSSLRLLTDHFGNQTGIQILDSEFNEITNSSAVQIDLTKVAEPDENNPGSNPGDSDAPGKPSQGDSGPVQPPDNQALGLKDISTHWAKKDIERMAQAGIITGDGQGYFHPDNAVTRAEVAAMAAKAYPLATHTGEVSFTDISGHWAEKDIITAGQQGYFLGSGGAFSPDRTITREELAVVIARVKGLSQEGKPDYLDIEQCSPWAVGAIAAVQRANLMTGLSDGSFRPQATVTRAEAAVVLSRCLDQ